jgi:hypothetical protein
MKNSVEAELWVNNASVELNPFVEEVLARTVAAAVSCLKGAEGIQNLELHLQGGDVRVVVNGSELPLTPFPNDIIANVVTAMVSSLKGIDEIENLRITVKVL